MVFHVGLCRSPRHSFAVMSITCACEGVLLKAKTFSKGVLAFVEEVSQLQGRGFRVAILIIVPMSYVSKPPSS